MAQRCTQKSTQDANVRQSVWVCLNAHASFICRSGSECILFKNTASRWSSTHIKMPCLAWVPLPHSTLIKQIRCCWTWAGGAAFVCIGKVGFQKVCSYFGIKMCRASHDYQREMQERSLTVCKILFSESFCWQIDRQVRNFQTQNYWRSLSWNFEWPSGWDESAGKRESHTDSLQGSPTFCSFNSLWLDC